VLPADGHFLEFSPTTQHVPVYPTHSRKPVRLSLGEQRSVTEDGEDYGYELRVVRVEVYDDALVALVS
jgi:hypothetical protein